MVFRTKGVKRDHSHKKLREQLPSHHDSSLTLDRAASLVKSPTNLPQLSIPVLTDVRNSMMVSLFHAYGCADLHDGPMVHT